MASHSESFLHNGFFLFFPQLGYFYTLPISASHKKNNLLFLLLFNREYESGALITAPPPPPSSTHDPRRNISNASIKGLNMVFILLFLIIM